MFVSRETCAYVSIERNTLYVSRIIEIRYSRGGSRKNVLGTWDIRNMPCVHINRVFQAAASRDGVFFINSN